MMTTAQVLFMESSQGSHSAVAAQVKEAIQAVAMGRIRHLTVEPQGKMIVVKGYCDTFHTRKEALDVAKLQICEAVNDGLIPEASLTDLIEVS